LRPLFYLYSTRIFADVQNAAMDCPGKTPSRKGLTEYRLSPLVPRPLPFVPRPSSHQSKINIFAEKLVIPIPLCFQ